MTGSARLREVAPGVHVLRYPVLDVNATLVLGDASAVVVDTLATDAQARELCAAVRTITARPLVVVNTHAHFDHCFGNTVLAELTPGGAVWAHEATTALLRDHFPRLRRAAIDECPALADELRAVVARVPDHSVTEHSIMDIGGRVVELRYLGRGHTDGDLVVTVPDAGVIIAGDLVEQGAPPAFADSYPLDWPETLDRLLALGHPTIVPGHGEVVDRDFVQTQQAALASLEWLIRDGHRDGGTIDEVAARGPFDPATNRLAVSQGFHHLR